MCINQLSAGCMSESVLIGCEVLANWAMRSHEILSDEGSSCLLCCELINYVMKIVSLFYIIILIMDAKQVDVGLCRVVSCLCRRV